MRKPVLILGVLLLATILSTGAALAGPKGTNRPFSGSGAGTTTVVPVAVGVFSSSSSGTLIATHLGKGSYTISATQTWGPDLGDVCAGSAIVGVVAGTATLTAANGDTLSGTLAGTVCELPPFDDTTYATSLTLTITGGTGRFAGATGTIAITGTSSGPAGGPFNDTSSMTGTISY